LIGLTATVLLLGAIGLVGTAGAAAAPIVAPQPLVITPAASVVGTWTLTTDFGCDGSITGSFTQTFNADNTWSSSPFIHSGRWYQVGASVVWTFLDTPNLVYSGNLSGSWFSGVQGFETVGGSTGCFGGHLASVPAVAGESSTTGRVDPATGR
jgi:hypothetical protein